ncbi:CHAT domain-containing protein [Pleurocapsa sp. PCC 7319]|uniref:CHAT domain-containing protein n=1 Tax=Pleurocapsa sp. PCC 7319 TaxID=118161 RepID=UPI00035EA84B|nr:CHAT domain-containing protein [Pleurocapsa sp. PCC 7319]
MARKRRLFSIKLQSQTILRKAINLIKSRNLVIFIFCSLLGLSSSLLLPASARNIPLLPDINQEQIQVNKSKIDSEVLLAKAESGKNSDILAITKKGQQQYNAGKFDEAINLWEKAAEAYQQVGNEEGVFSSLVNKAQAQQNLGTYPRACKTLLQAFAFEQPNCDSEQVDLLLDQFSPNSQKISIDRAIAFRSLGEVLRLQGQLKESQKVLEYTLSNVQGLPVEGATQLSLANTKKTLGIQTRHRWNYEQITEIIASQSQSKALEPDISAIESYQKVETSSSTSPMTKVQAQLNHLSLLVDLKQWWQAEVNRRISSWSRVDDSRLIQRAEGFLSLLNTRLNPEIATLQTTIKSNINDLPPTRAAISARINFANQSLKLSQIDIVEPQLTTSLEQARSLQDSESESYALGYMGLMYYKQWQQLDSSTQSSNDGQKILQQAKQMTEQSLLLAENSQEISYLWQSQLGNILRDLGDTKGAISSYFAAFNTLQSLRTDLNKNNQDLQFDFRQEIQPVYKSLADLLLKSELSEPELESLIVLNPQTSQTKSQIKPQKNRLELARTIIESLQIAELDNFFQDPCVEEAQVAIQIEDLDNQAAVIYPIIFPNRLEVILSLPKQPLKQTTIAIAETKFNETLDSLYDNLYNESFNDSAINIFKTVPLRSRQVEANTQNLLPILTQLYEWLIRPFESELNSSQIETLAFVLNDRLQRVPMAALYDGKQYLIENYGIAYVPSLQLQSLTSQQSKSESLSILAAGVNQQVEIDGKLFSALDKVALELNQIGANCPNCQQLLNEEFTAKRLENELKQQPYDVLHLATHGLFSSNPEKTFIVTGDGESINVDKLNQLLSVGKTNIPELLVLSACDTAAGDEKAVLGLAGVAVRSGTSSTIASLWPVGDKFTADLMTQFYQELRKPNSQKVNALKNSQLSLINFLRENPRFESLKDLPPHPFYWSPYVLVGNWQ